MSARSPLLIVLLLAAPAAGAAGEARPARLEGAIDVPAVDTAPVVDGRLDDDAWASAAVLDGFRETYPGDNAEPPCRTALLLARDRDHLYVAFRAEDDPARVRATLAPRDRIFDDDHVGLYLDTFGDRERAYALFFNPFGIQADGLYTEGAGTELELDLVLASRGEVNEGGYAVEAAIPFASLRFPKRGDGRWGLHAVRTVQHLGGETQSWRPVDRDADNFLAQAGAICGFEALESARPVDVIPTFSFVSDGRLAPGVGGATIRDARAANAGLTVRLGLATNVSLDLAANPDFAEVEADAPVVAANRRFPVLSPEKRPFFLEGADVFRVPFNAIYTRRVVDPDLAVKVTGKVGRTSFGLLAASDAGPGNFTRSEREDPLLGPRVARFLDRNAIAVALRLKRLVGEDSSVGCFVTSYDFVERHNDLAGLDASLRVGRSTRLNLAAAGSTTRAFFFDPGAIASPYRTGNGLAYSASLSHAGRNLSWSVGTSGRTRDFRALLGFSPRADYATTSAYLGYSATPRADAALVGWNVAFDAHAGYDFRGRMHASGASVSATLQLAGQTTVSARAGASYDRVFETEFGAARSAIYPGTFAGAPERSARGLDLSIGASTTPSERVSLYGSLARTGGLFDYDLGAGPAFPRVSPVALADPFAPLDPGRATATSAAAGAVWNASDALQLDASYAYGRLRREDTGRLVYASHLVSARASYHVTRALELRAVLDRESLAATLRGQVQVRYAPAPGTSFHAGYTTSLDTSGLDPFTGEPGPGPSTLQRTFYAKVSYLFRTGW